MHEQGNIHAFGMAYASGKAHASSMAHAFGMAYASGKVLACSMAYASGMAPACPTSVSKLLRATGYQPVARFDRLSWPTVSPPRLPTAVPAGRGVPPVQPVYPAAAGPRVAVLWR